MSGTPNSTSPESEGTGFFGMIQLWLHERPHRYLNRALLLIGLVSLIRFWLLGRFELLGSEAYFWLWSKHLDICYLTKGPFIAWVIAVSTSLFGETEWGVRFFSVVLAAGSAIGLFLLTRRLFSPRAGFYAVVVYLLSPLATLSGVFMTVDPLGLFFWIWAAYTFWLARSSNKASWWALTGLLVGLGLLSKYINLLQLACFLLFCLLSTTDRLHLRRRSFWLMFLPVLLCSIPIIAWNHRYDWVGMTFALDRGKALVAETSFSHLAGLGQFVLDHSLVFSPLLALTMLVLLFRAGWRHLRKSGQQVVPYRVEWLFLLSLLIPPLLFFLVDGWLQTRWPIGVLLCGIPGFMALAAVWTNSRTGRLTREWLKIVVVVSGLMTAHLYAIVWFGPPFSLPSDAIRHVQGSRHFALEVSRLQKSCGANYIVANRYPTASLLSFYMPDQPTVYLPYDRHVTSQFSFWLGYDETLTGENSALYLSDQRQLPPPSFVRQFHRVDYLKKLDARHSGDLIRAYHAYFCDTFIGLPEEWSAQP
jgi:hypothetical protein